MFTEELLEGTYQPGHVQAMDGGEIPDSFLVGNAHLRGPGQLPGDDFSVDTIADAHPGADLDQTQVVNVFQIVQGELLQPFLIRGQQLTDHAANAGLSQLVRQLVQVRGPGLDQGLPGRPVVLQGQGAAAVAGRFEAPGEFIAQGIHQPGLAVGVFP